MSKRKDRPYYRTYTHHKRGQQELVTWMQRRCKVCGRFIGGSKQFLCELCYIKQHKQQNKQSHFERRDQVQYYSFETIKDIIDLPIPDYLRNNLRGYM